MFDEIMKPDFIPLPTMSLREKTMAIGRSVVILTLVSFFATGRSSIIIAGGITITLLTFLFYLRSTATKEGYTDNNETNNDDKKKPPEGIPADLPAGEQLAKDAAEVRDILTTAPIDLKKVPRDDFHPITKNNPLGNVLLTEITDNPNRKAAPPSFNPDIHDDINAAAKKQTQALNKGIKNTDKQLYGDLWSNFQFDTECMRNFYTTANTRVCNDQGAFAQYLYGDMPSAKSSGPDGAFARVQDNPRYNLY